MRTLTLAGIALAMTATVACAQPKHPFIFDPTGGKWPLVQEQMKAQEPMLGACTANVANCRSSAALEQWRVIVNTAAKLDDLDKLRYVNSAINRVVRWSSAAAKRPRWFALS